MELMLSSSESFNKNKIMKLWIVVVTLLVFMDRTSMLMYKILYAHYIIRSQIFESL